MTAATQAPTGAAAWFRSSFAARPILMCVVAGGFLGVFVIHTTAAFAMEPHALSRAWPTLVRAFSWSSFPLLSYHAIMGVVVGCGAGVVATRAYRRQIAERERANSLETQLARAQKLESVGRLAAGVAHDFNNILTAIGIGVYLAKADATSGKDPTAHLADVERSVQRGAHLPRQLLAFARRQPSEPKLVDAAALVRDLEKMLQRIIGEDVRLSTDLTPATLRVDPGQFEQVLVNLAVNARDAMPEGGHLHIATRIVHLAPHELPDEDLPPGDYVVTSVTDEGTGIPDAIRDRIFEPFFTTKQEGKGTGLGLATVYGIVKQNGGAITLDTKMGRGTTFHIHLPLVHAPALQTETPTATLAQGDGASVLVVDDQAAVRTVVAQALRRLGYRVNEASSGAEAIARAELLARDGPFILLTDVVMHGLRGPELARRLRRAHPTMRVVYMTGYADQDIHRELAGELVLEKPFTPEGLTETLRAAAR